MPLPLPCQYTTNDNKETRSTSHLFISYIAIWFLKSTFSTCCYFCKVCIVKWIYYRYNATIISWCNTTSRRHFYNITIVHLNCRRKYHHLLPFIPFIKILQIEEVMNSTLKSIIFTSLHYYFTFCFVTLMFLWWVVVNHGFLNLILKSCKNTEKWNPHLQIHHNLIHTLFNTYHPVLKISSYVFTILILPLLLL